MHKAFAVIAKFKLIYSTWSLTVKTSTPKVDGSVQAVLSEEENCEFLRELPFCPYTDQVLPPQPSVPGYRESHPEEP